MDMFKQEIISTGIVLLLFSCDLEEIQDEIPITFRKTFGRATYHAYGSAVQQTQDDGYVITGYTVRLGAGGYDVYLIKTDAFGDTTFTKTFGGLGFLDDEGRSVQQTDDGGYIITGYTDIPGPANTNVYLIKTDANGKSQFQHKIGGTSFEQGMSVQQTDDGGYIIAGSIFSGAKGYDVYLIKTDALGNVTFTNQYGGPDDDYGRSVQQTQDGGYIITGSIFYGARGYDVYLIKTDADGVVEFTQNFGGTSSDDVGESEPDDGYAVQQTQDGGYIITGSTKSFGAGESDVYLIKTDPHGTIVLVNYFGGPKSDEGRSVQQTEDGGYIITGVTNSFGAGENDMYLIKTDAFLDSTFTRTFGGTSSDEGRSVQQTQDGGYIITGHTWSSESGSPKVYLIKTDVDGIVY
jgi:hypothetical protein